MEFRRQTLDNGLEVIAECNPAAYSMAAAFFVNTGARDERHDLAGVSHFLEHMVFKGTATRSAADVNRELDQIGSQSNAYTSEEQTVYYVAVVPDYQNRAIELLSDLMRPALREDDFEVEKKVIIEEIRKYDDQPPFGAHERCMAAYFGSHPLGNSILGTVESVSALTPNAMREYFDERYSPGNLKLVAAGQVDFDRLVKLADRWCGNWVPHAATRNTPASDPQQKTQWICRDQATQQYAVQISGGPPATDEQRFAHRVMSVVFGDESGSRLFWALVDPGLAEFASMGTYEFQGAGIAMTYLSCPPGNLTDNLHRLRELQESIQQDGVSPEEVEIAKSKICSQVVRRAERPLSRLFSVGSNWTQRGIYRTVKDSVESYSRVTADDITATLKRYPLTEHATVLAGPLPPPEESS